MQTVATCGSRTEEEMESCSVTQCSGRPDRCLSLHETDPLRGRFEEMREVMLVLVLVLVLLRMLPIYLRILT